MKYISSIRVYEVVGWRLRRGLPRPCVLNRNLPDRYWYGERPRLLKDFKGEGVDKLIASVDRAAKSYPWPDTYTAFPGPNSNTFIAWIAREVPELGLNFLFQLSAVDMRLKTRKGRGHRSPSFQPRHIWQPRTIYVEIYRSILPAARP